MRRQQYTVETTQDTPRSRAEYTLVDPDGEYRQTYRSLRAAQAAAARASRRRTR
ncbi:hypothetical protein MTQ13_03105 [Streptomyces sp. XM4011]|uniref:hypothetical protein n=1 Tax=Streptomyces sp. XM4011 TaxID=2929780 RepID=UPI001FF93953|nr:hypothetical protein [Streptomyces sp. XM4011]MCK1813269.1 hypothetical protein [Streptomyces sp. XM4011]